MSGSPVFPSTNLSRRRLITALASGAALASPFTRLLAQGVHTPPRRLVIFYVPEGTIRENWLPVRGAGGAFTYGSILAPLDAPGMSVKSKVTVLDGVHMNSRKDSPGSGHTEGAMACLTGVSPWLDTGVTGGLSIDHYLAKINQGKTRLGTLSLGINSYVSVSFPNGVDVGGGNGIMLQNDPFQCFQTAFGSSSSTRLQATTSLIDTNKEQIAAMKALVGTEDAKKLDRHLEAFRQLEVQVGITRPSDTRALPSCPTSFDANQLLGAKAASDNLPVLGKQQMDIAVQALTCDVSRVVLLHWNNSNSRQTFPWLGISSDHHGMSHGNGTPAGRAVLTNVYTWYATQYADLLRKLASVPEGEGTLLDNTVVLWISEFGDGGAHSLTNLPCLIGGNAGGALKQGNFLSLGGRSHNDVLLTLLAAVGHPAAAFGTQKYSGSVIREMFNA